MARVQAYNSSYDIVDVWGPIDVFAYGNGAYVAIPTSAPAGEKLAYFQDTSASWILFRNNTLALPVNGQAANFVLATGDLLSDGARFYGQVTGMEVDTKALDGDGASAIAVLYLNELPGRASYSVSLTEDANIKKAVMGQASIDGQPGDVKLMLDVSGQGQGARSSISYTVVRMKADGPEPDGNVTAYRYFNGAVSRLPCRAIRSANDTVYETICAGQGTFAFVGPFPEQPPGRASLKGVLVFSGAVGVMMLALVAITVIAFKRSVRR
jgi:hypothetical protein